MWVQLSPTYSKLTHIYAHFLHYNHLLLLSYPFNLPLWILLPPPKTDGCSSRWYRLLQTANMHFSYLFFSVSKKVKDVWSFLGLVNWYSRFIKNDWEIKVQLSYCVKSHGSGPKNIKKFLTTCRKPWPRLPYLPSPIPASLLRCRLMQVTGP